MVRLSVDREPPTLQVARQSRLIAQGRTLPIWVDADEPLARAEVAIFGKTVPMYPVDGAWRALVGVAIRQPPGEASLRVVAHDEAGNRAVLETEVAVETTEFETTGQIALTRADIEQDRDPEDARLARRARDEAYARRSPAPRWEGPMGLPVAYGKAAAPFGRYFTYRDGERSYHTGLDLEKRLGARISAPAAGTVSLVTTQPVFGRVVIVDHGHGVSTAYNHLDTVEVKRGDEVYRGQSLGTMGASGQAYGPHLHWVVVVAGTAVDPADWLDDDFATSPFR